MGDLRQIRGAEGASGADQGRRGEDGLTGRGAAAAARVDRCASMWAHSSMTAGDDDGGRFSAR